MPDESEGQPKTVPTSFQRCQVDSTRTHSSLMNDLKVDPKIVADQLGHSLNVNQNIYTQSAMERRKEAVDSLESALLNA